MGTLDNLEEIKNSEEAARIELKGCNRLDRLARVAAKRKSRGLPIAERLSYYVTTFRSSTVTVHGG